MNKTLSRALAAVLALGATSVNADIVHNDDVIITGSQCVGFDCVNGEAFGADTIRLKENNLRIHIDDTSNSASFPNNDWRLTFNDQTNGGQNKFSVDDVTAGRTPFTIEAAAPSNSLYVDSSGRIGLGTANPVVEAHIVDGDTPTLRLEQDGSSGFQAQTWDVAGNETNFFVRDVTNGSRLPFRIRPGAPSSSIDIAADGDVGIGTGSPGAPLHITRSNLTTATDNLLTVENTSTNTSTSARVLLRNSRITASATNDPDWVINSNGTFRVSAGADAAELTLDAAGNLTVTGSFRVNGTTLNVPDYVFEPSYQLRTLEEVDAFITEHRHLPDMPSQQEVAEAGLDMTDMQLRLLRKVEELTLYAVKQQETIAQLEREIAALNRADR